MKKRLVKILTCIFCIVFILAATVLPVLAFDYNQIPSTTVYRPMWNLTHIRINVGSSAYLVELPTHWFKNSDIYSNSLVALHLDDSSQVLNIGVDMSMIDTFKGVILSIPLSNADSVQFFYDDTIIPYTALGGGDEYFQPLMITGVTKPVSTSGRFNFAFGSFTYSKNGNYVIGRRYVNYGRQSINNLRELGDGSPSSVGPPRGGYSLTPNNDWVQYLSGFSPELSSMGLSGCYMHFFDMEASAVVTGMDRLEVVVPLVEESFYVNFYNYIRATFPGYLLDEDSDLSDIGTFLASSLGGFLDFEIMPNISIGDLFMTCVGIGLVVILLKFFSGG
jgi:hypothetical protein